MSQIMLSFKCLRSYSQDKEIAIIALRKIIKFKVDQFVLNYGHDSVKAYAYL